MTPSSPQPDTQLVNGRVSRRFWSRVVKGPDETDCWLWTGAIGDDGYGRFWTKNDSGQLVVRPQRFAYEQITGRALHPDVMLLHWCDVPLCVHAHVDADRSHVREGTGVDNMLDRSQRGRYSGPATRLGAIGVARAERTRRSRALRQVILEHGWDRERIAHALAGRDGTEPTLF